MSYTIKAGDLIPGISGTIVVPTSIDLTGAVLTLEWKGMATPKKTGIATLGAKTPGITTDTWAWSYSWVAGDTDDADEYELGITTEVGGDPITFPNSGWGSFTIEAAL